MKRNFLITVDGQTFDVTVADKDFPGAGTGETSLAALREGNTGGPCGEETSEPRVSAKAPMSGKILSVLVREGEVVERGQPLLVLEALKLENDIVAPREGRIQQVLVSAGQLVDTGEELILIAKC